MRGFETFGLDDSLARFDWGHDIEAGTEVMRAELEVFVGEPIDGGPWCCEVYADGIVGQQDGATPEEALMRAFAEMLEK